MPRGIKNKTQDEVIYTWGNKQVFTRKSTGINRADTQSNNDNRQLLSLDLIISAQNGIHSIHHRLAASASALSPGVERRMFTFWSDPQYPGSGPAFICWVCTQCWASCLAVCFGGSSNSVSRRECEPDNCLTQFDRLPAETCAQHKYLSLNPLSYFNKRYVILMTIKTLA